MTGPVQRAVVNMELAEQAMEDRLRDFSHSPSRTTRDAVLTAMDHFWMRHTEFRLAERALSYTLIVYIYGLRDPRDQQFRYVGYTTSPESRVLAHWTDRLRVSSAKADWLRTLEAAGLRPELVILEETTGEERFTAESRWIAKLKTEGHPVVNTR